MNETTTTPNRGWLFATTTVAVSLALAGLVAWAGGQGGARMPGAALGGTPVIWICAAVAFGVQWIAFVPAYLRRTEHFYDLTGSLTYLSVVACALLFGGSTHPRSWLIALLVTLWAGRLGSFLFARIRADGRDTRFDGVRDSAPRFLVGWTLQGLWVLLTLAAALAAMTSATPSPLSVLDALGLAVWLVGFAIEVRADAQKRAFRRTRSHPGEFIRSGLWAWSRHPNYFGEIVLWAGVALISSTSLQGWQWVTMISPIFVIVLLTRVSGIPLLEESADERYGDDPSYQQYKQATPVLIPRRPAPTVANAAGA